MSTTTLVAMKPTKVTTYEITQIPHDEAKGPFRFVVWEKDPGGMKYPLCVCYMEDGAREVVTALQALAATRAALDAQDATKKARIKPKSLSTSDVPQ